MDDLVEHLGRLLAHEGPPPGQELVQDHAHREDVAAPVEGLGADLLGAHVVDGPDHHAALGEVGPAQLGDPEVHDLHGAVVEQPDVRRLDVAVDDPVLVGVGEAAADLDHDVEHLGEEQRLAGADQGLEVGAGQELHGDERHAAVLAQLVDGDDVGVLQARRRLGLDLEAAAALLVEGALDRRVLTATSRSRTSS